MIASNVPFRKIFSIETLSSFFSEFESNLTCGSFKSYKNPSHLILNSRLEFCNFFHFSDHSNLYLKFDLHLSVNKIQLYSNYCYANNYTDASKRNCSSIMYMYLVRDNDLYWSNIISSP